MLVRSGSVLASALAPLNMTALVVVSLLKRPEFPMAKLVWVSRSTVESIETESASPRVYEQLITSVVSAPMRSCAASVMTFVSRKPYGMTVLVRRLCSSRVLSPRSLDRLITEMTECSPALLVLRAM